MLTLFLHTQLVLQDHDGESDPPPAVMRARACQRSDAGDVEEVLARWLSLAWSMMKGVKDEACSSAENAVQCACVCSGCSVHQTRSFH